MSRIPRKIAGLGASDLPNAVAFDAYVGPAREITVDPQRGIIALHNGATPGGKQFDGLLDGHSADYFATAEQGAKADTALQPADIGTVNATDADLTAVYGLPVPALFRHNFSGSLACNPTGGDDFYDMANWCWRANGDVTLKIADGLHTLNSNLQLRGPNTLNLDASGIPDFIEITGIAYSTVSGTTRQATITVATALPARVVAGFPVGIQFPQGNNNAASAAGGQIVKTVAGDRLSFTFDFSSVTLPTAPSTFNAAIIFGVTPNRVMIPKAALICNSAGWDGGGVEGHFNVHNGSVLAMRYLGFGYSGAAGTEHDLFFGENAQIRFTDYCALAGAGDAVIRMVERSSVWLNRICVGGSAKAKQLIYSQLDGYTRLNRSSLGGATQYGINLGQTSASYLANSIVASTPTGVYSLGDSVVDFISAILDGNQRGIYAVGGSVRIGSATTIANSSLAGIDIDGGKVYGEPTTWSGNTVDNFAPRNSEYKGGLWQADTSAPVRKTYLQRISLANNAMLTSVVGGTGTGVVRFDGDIAPEDGAILSIDSNSAAYATIFAGADVVMTTGDITAVSNAGRITISVWNDAGVYKLQIKNEDGGGRKYDVYVEGSVTLGTFA